MSDWNLLAPDEDARDLAATARAQFESRHGRFAARAALDGAPTGDDDWAMLVSGGYLDIGLPEELGGLGRLIDLVVVLEEAGRTLLTAPLLPAAVAYQTQLAAGLHRPEWRTWPATFAAAAGTIADGRCFVERAHLLGGRSAATLTAVVRGPDRAWVAVLDPRSGPIEVPNATTVIDPSRPIPTVRLRGAPCLEAQEIALDEVELLLAGARVCVAADLVGVAAGALDAAVAHAQQRIQFGAPIGAFQAVKHQLADAYVAVERARSLAFGSALGLAPAKATPLSTRDSLLANATAAEAAVQVAWRYTQLLGAMGVTFEADAHLYLRRAHQMAALFGAPDELFLAAARIERGLHR